MSDVPLPEPSLEIGGKLLPYERRHFHTPGMAAKLGYTEGLQQYWNAEAVHAYAAAVSAADNAALRENGQRLLAVADSAVQHQHDMIEAACAPLREQLTLAESVRASQVAGLTEGLAGLEQDAARYRWLAPRLIAADFAWGDPAVPVLVFEWPANIGVSVDCDTNIDAALKGEA